MDDMAIHTKPQDFKTKEQHVERYWEYVRRVLQKLEEHHLFLKPEKCTFEQSSIKFLGVVVNQGTVWMDDSKIAKVKNWQLPTNITEIQKLLGFMGYYWYFIQDYSHLAWPLLDLTQKATPWHWEKDQQGAFETLHDQMCSKPVLCQPDFTKQFFVHTDTLAYGMGAILLQEGEPNPTNPQKPK
jgi:hypothetical protein